MGKRLANKKCEHCGKEFKPSHSYNKYCSVECARKGRSTLGNGICENCGKEFKVENKGQKYCGIECRRAAVSLPIIKCQMCGKEVKATRKGQMFCSITCSNKSRKVRNSCKTCGKPCPRNKVYCCEECRITGYKDSRKKAKICLACGKEFFRKDSKYCSTDCYKEYLKKQRLRICPVCGKEFYRGQVTQKFCSKECKGKAFRLPEKECLVCGKSFHSNKREIKYCSRECFIKSWEDYNTREVRMAHLWNTPKTVVTQPNLELKAYLEGLGYDVELEYKLGGYSYDLKIGDTLVEVNPYPYHNVTRYPYGSGRAITKEYHYNKYICAIEHGYKCIMVWDWTSYDEVVDMIEDKRFHYEGPPRLHRYNGKTGEHIIDNGLNKEDMLGKGFVEIYDCGEETFTLNKNKNE